MKAYKLNSHFVSGLCLLALVAPAWSAENGITAQIDSQTIDAGQSAQLTVTLNDAQAPEPQIPQVAGLDIESIGQQNSTEIVNGAVSSSVSYLYQVTPNHAGRFTIPPITIADEGSTQPISFRVENGGGGQPNAAPSQSFSQQPATSPDSDGSAPADAGNQPAFLRVILPKQELTVGELVPVEVKAYFRDGVSASLDGLPMISSDAFSLDKLSDQPRQTSEAINGLPYTVATWTTTLSAVKAGDYPLNLDLPVTVQVPERASRHDNSPFGSMLDDSFFDNFVGQTAEKSLTLHAQGDIVKIKALPLQGRPAGFSGAVGTFDVSAEAGAATGSTGDPLTLKINISGHGNFDRVSTNGLSSSDEWKSYRPSVKFQPEGGSAASGTKTFEQSVVPMKAGSQDIPSIRFSYFDPATQSYVTKTTSPIPVDIAQNSAPAPVVSQPAIAAAAAAPQSSPGDLAPDEVVPAHAGATLRPLVLAPWFITFNVALVFALALVAIISRIRSRRENDPVRLQRETAESAVDQSLAAMDAALQARDAAGFFGAARRALQVRLAAVWQVPASQVTIPAIRTRLKAKGEEIRAVFQAADEIAYSGKRFSPRDLQHWRDVVQTQLQQLTRI
jgi:hypothetical protein